MADIVDKATRSRWMSGIRSRDTRPEILVRRFLHRAGLRFRLGGSGLPGRPDLILPRWRTVVFVHGCFWHRHPGCPYAYHPKSRQRFWERKFSENIARDRRSIRKLRKLGWRTLVIWECQVNDKGLERLLLRLMK